MSSDLMAVRVERLSKHFQIYENSVDRLKQFVFPRVSKFFFRKPRTYFREFSALNDISFEVKRGETVGIVGRNGSGKSTLLQLICGTLAASNGEITVNGKIAALLELGSGFNPEFTGRENVLLYGVVLGLSQREVNKRMGDILDFADIGDFIEQPVKTYSSGMVVRLAFAVAVNVDPDILVVDEALAVGDEIFQRKCFARIDEIKASGATILFVSHSGGTVVSLCDRAILLDEGTQLMIGHPKTVLENYHKLIYASAGKVDDVRRSIQFPEAELVEPEASSVDDVIPEQLEAFDPNLIPKSSIEFEPEGARIHSPKIKDLNGNDVNVLVSGRRYSYFYTVNMLDVAQKVRFGMMIKNIAGIELGGYATDESLGDGVFEVPTGTVCEIKFEFDCNLAEGVYFLNAGVLGLKSGTETYLHRIFDITMFRVITETETLMTGMVDFNCTPIVFISD